MVKPPNITRWDRVAEPHAALHILHGMVEYGARYDRLARALNARGVIVWAHDHRGHGATPFPAQGHFDDKNGWQRLIDDAWDVSRQLQEATRLPLFMFAHSMGSFVGQGVMAAHGDSYRGVVFSGTNGPPQLDERLLRAWAGVLRLGGARKPGAAVRKFVFDAYNKPFGPPPNSWLSRDATEVERYNQDPLCRFDLTVQAWIDLLDARAAQSDAGFFRKVPPDLAIRVIAGTNDPVGQNAAGVQRLLKTFQDAGLRNVSYQPYAGARHELTNETNRDEVTEELVAWLEDVLNETSAPA